MLKKIAALLLVPVLLAGCSAAGDVETLLRAPQLSGESAALQKALNNYLGGSATLKYPASGDFLSPFAFGDWDGDGTDEAAVLYTTDTTSSNVWLAVLEPTGESSWRVSRVVEGLTSEVQSFSAAHLRDTSSQQLLAGKRKKADDSKTRKSTLEVQKAVLDKAREHIVEEIRQDRENLEDYRRIAKEAYTEQYAGIVRRIRQTLGVAEKTKLVLLLGLLEEDYKATMGGCQDGNCA